MKVTGTYSTAGELTHRTSPFAADESTKTPAGVKYTVEDDCGKVVESDVRFCTEDFFHINLRRFTQKTGGLVTGGSIITSEGSDENTNAFYSPAQPKVRINP